MDAGILAKIITWPVEKVCDWTNPVIEKVIDAVEKYFKEIVFFIGSFLLAHHAADATIIGALTGLVFPISMVESAVEGFDDADKPVRYRFAAQVLLGSCCAMMEPAYPGVRILQVGTVIGAMGIGCVFKRFYVFVIKN